MHFVPIHNQERLLITTSGGGKESHPFIACSAEGSIDLAIRTGCVERTIPGDGALRGQRVPKSCRVACLIVVRVAHRSSVSPAPHYADDNQPSIEEPHVSSRNGDDTMVVLQDPLPIKTAREIRNARPGLRTSSSSAVTGNIFDATFSTGVAESNYGSQLRKPAAMVRMESL